MAEFQNTIDLLGDEAVTKAIVEKTITEFNDDVITTVGTEAFRSMATLTSVDLPNVTDIGTTAFRGCGKLKNINLPLWTGASGKTSIFYSCSSLQYIDLPNVTIIEASTFYYCNSLAVVILRSDTICTLSNKSAFTNTPFNSGKAGGTLLIPRTLVTGYSNATNWSSIKNQNTKNRFLALEDYTVDGTITGEIDWDKLNGGTT